MSDTNRGRIAYVRQTKEGVLPTTLPWQVMRFNTSSLAFEKQTTESSELSAEGMTTDLPQVGARSAGSFSIEWSAKTYDDFIEAATRGTWGNEISYTGAFTIDTETHNTITAATGTPFANARVGQFILVAGCTEGESYSGALDSPNNGWWEIEAVTSDTVIRIKDPGDRLLDETGVTGGKVSSKCLVNGQRRRFFAFEEGFLDVGAFLLFLDQYINTLSMSMSANQITTGSIEVMGSDVNDEQVRIHHNGQIVIAATGRTVTAVGAFEHAEAGQRIFINGMVNSGNNGEHIIASVTDDDAVVLTTASSNLADETLASGGEILGYGPTWSSSATYAMPNEEAVLNSTANVGSILINDELSTACFRALDINLTNNMRETGCIGRMFPRIGYGRQGISGSFEKLFANLDLWRAMKNHDDLSMVFGVINPAKTEGIHIKIPRLKIGSDQVDLSAGNDSDVVDNVQWTALRYADTTLGENYHIQICVAA